VFDVFVSGDGMPDGGGRHGGERESVDSRLLLWESVSRGRVSKGSAAFVGGFEVRIGARFGISSFLALLPLKLCRRWFLVAAKQPKRCHQ